MRTAGSYNTDSAGVYAPNVFTPNGDGINDVFNIKTRNLVQYELKVYKQLTLVFSTTDSDDAWDGEYNGLIDEGSYQYVVRFTTALGEQVQGKGEFCLLKSASGLENLSNCTECKFGDMIDPRKGFVYPTGEMFGGCN